MKKRSLLLALGAGGALLGAWAWLHKSSSDKPHVGATPEGLKTGQLYRFKLAEGAPVGSIHEQLRYRDPTAPKVWTVLGSWKGGPTTPGILHAEPLEDLPKPSPVANVKGLDAGLTEAEVDLVKHVIGEDDDPKHLGGIASTFEPDFPVVASLLRAKATLALAQKQRTRRCEGCGKSARFEEDGLQVCSDECKKSLENAPEAAETITALERASAPLGPRAVQTWKKFEKAIRGLGARAIPPPEPTPDVQNVPPDRDALRRTVMALVKDVRMMALTGDQISHELGVHPGIARCAKSLVTVLPGGIALVKPVLNLPRPHVSASALVLAHSTMRPTVSRVANPKNIKSQVRTIRSLAKEGETRNLDAYERAERALSRQKWLSWHERMKHVKS